MEVTKMKKNVRFFTLKYGSEVMTLISKVWKDKAYADVTIIAQGVKFLAHRMVLSLSSQLLTEILSDTPQDPVISLDGTTKEDLALALEIIYNGGAASTSDRYDTVMQLLDRLGVAADITNMGQNPNSNVPVLARKGLERHTYPIKPQTRQKEIYCLSIDQCQNINQFNCLYCRNSYKRPELLFEHVRFCSQKNTEPLMESVGDSGTEGLDKSVLQTKQKSRKRQKQNEVSIEGEATTIACASVPNALQKKSKLEETGGKNENNGHQHSVSDSTLCKVCSANFENAWLLKLHESSSCGKYPTVCNHCRRRVPIPTHISHLVHSLDVHCKSECPVCHAVPLEGYLEAFRTHVKAHIPAEMKKFTCNICSDIFLTLQEQVLHAKTHQVDGQTLEVTLHGPVKGQQSKSQITPKDDTNRVDPLTNIDPSDQTNLSPVRSTVRIVKPMSRPHISPPIIQESETDYPPKFDNVQRVNTSNTSRGPSGYKRGRGRPRLTNVVTGNSLGDRGHPVERQRGNRRGRTGRCRGANKTNVVPKASGRGRSFGRPRLIRTFPVSEEKCVVCNISLKPGRKASALHKRLCWSKIFHCTESVTTDADSVECAFCDQRLALDNGLRDAVEKHYVSEVCSQGFEVRNEMMEDIDKRVVDDFGDTFLIEIDHADDDQANEFGACDVKREPEDFDALGDNEFEEVEDLSIALNKIPST